MSERYVKRGTQRCTVTHWRQWRMCRGPLFDHLVIDTWTGEVVERLPGGKYGQPELNHQQHKAALAITRELNAQQDMAAGMEGS